DYPQIASILVPLASLGRVQGRLVEAEAMLHEAARIAELSRRTYVLSVAKHELGKVYADRKRHGEAERLYRASLGLTGDSVGTRNTEYAVCLADLAYSLAAQRKYVEAEVLLREAIRTKEEIGGSSSFSLPVLLERHAQLLGKLKRKEESKHVLARLKALLAAGGGDPNGQTVDVLELKPRR
ncbi:MAG: tetratricopeptide repeat protein, partial [Bryobacterales bacterium]|nr:tetratricopeptide repeat protein [Bryobacterales bacterium]